MSADVWINQQPCEHCGRSDTGDDLSLNITYNLSSMLREAGFIGWRYIVGMPAPVVGKHIVGVLDGMALNPTHWRGLNPRNGWGDYDECIQERMRAWAEKCMEQPETSTIGASL